MREIFGQSMRVRDEGKLMDDEWEYEGGNEREYEGGGE